MITYNCDRCGRKLEYEQQTRVFTRAASSIYFEQASVVLGDLCNNCVNSLREFMKPLSQAAVKEKL